MSYLNPNWLKINNEAINIMSKYGGSGEDITPFLEATDIEIRLVVTNPPVSLPASEITLDVDDHVTADCLRQFGTYWCIAEMFDGYSGSGSGNPDDIYSVLAGKYYKKADRARSRITEEAIKEGDEDTAKTDLGSPYMQL